MKDSVGKTIGGLYYKLVDGYKPSYDGEKEAVLEQAALFHKFVNMGKEKPTMATVTDFESGVVTGALFTYREIIVYAEKSWMKGFLDRLDIACREGTSVWGTKVNSSSFSEYPFVTKASEESIVKEEFNTFNDAWIEFDVVGHVLAIDISKKPYEYNYKIYKIHDFVTSTKCYSDLFENKPKKAPESIKSSVGEIIKEPIKKASVGVNNGEKSSVLDRMKEQGLLNLSNVDFKDPEHAILYKKMCDLELLFKSLNLESVVSETIERVLDGHIVTKSIKTYSGKGEKAPAKKRKLTAECIIERYNSGQSVSSLALEAGVSNQAIYAILKKNK